MDWITKTGEKIPIKKMTDSHLANAIASIERYADECEEVVGGFDHSGYIPDVPVPAHKVLENHPFYAVLKAEQERRAKCTT